MAWRSSGTNNAEMVDKLTRFGVITSDHVERAFRRVDRKFFVPRGNEATAHSDQPLKEGNVHISAPHIYGSAVEALDLVPNSSLSFLNIGSGTGYISCVVAEILGPRSLHYGVELYDDVIEHCKASMAKWKTNAVDESGDMSTFQFMDTTPTIRVIKGNGLNIVDTTGECVVGFDRIYIGAAVSEPALAKIIKLLSPGGILVGPVDDKLVKVVRMGNISLRDEDHIPVGDAERFSRLQDEFTSEILTGVRFAPLLIRPALQTILPSHAWDPSVQLVFPTEFQRASVEILMCSNSRVVQPLPALPTPEERTNAAALLPRAIWVEILSYTHRKWFEPRESSITYLERRLREEKAKAIKAENARREAEDRCRAAEREKAAYRTLARRCHSRLNAILAQQGQDRRGNNHHVEPGRVEWGVGSFLNYMGGVEDVRSLTGLRLLLQHLDHDDILGDDDEPDDEDGDSGGEDEGDDMDHDMEEENIDVDEESQQHGEADGLTELFDDVDDNDSDDFLSVAEEVSVPLAASMSYGDSFMAENESVVMDDVDYRLSRAYDQPRTVSISSDDL